MPYEHLPSPPDQLRLHLWPYRSLPRRGFAGFIAVTATLLALPLLVLLGTPVLWGILPFLVAAVTALWWALERSYKDGEILEDLTLGETEITLTRHGPRGRLQSWSANPHWVRLNLHPTAGPVPNYLTLTGAGREVELGAFLSEAERGSLHAALATALRAQK